MAANTAIPGRRRRTIFFILLDRFAEYQIIHSANLTASWYFRLYQDAVKLLFFAELAKNTLGNGIAEFREKSTRQSLFADVIFAESSLPSANTQQSLCRGFFGLCRVFCPLGKSVISGSVVYLFLIFVYFLIDGSNSNIH